MVAALFVDKVELLVRTFGVWLTTALPVYSVVSDLTLGCVATIHAVVVALVVNLVLREIHVILFVCIILVSFGPAVLPLCILGMLVKLWRMSSVIELTDISALSNHTL